MKTRRAVTGLTILADKTRRHVASCTTKVFDTDKEACGWQGRSATLEGAELLAEAHYRQFGRATHRVDVG